MAEVKKVNEINPETCPLCSALKKLKEKTRQEEFGHFSWFKLIFIALGAYITYKTLKKTPVPTGQLRRVICFPIISRGDIQEAYIADKFGKATHLLFLSNQRPIAISVEHLPTGIDVARVILKHGANTIIVGSVGDKVRKFLEDRGVEIKTGYIGKIKNYLKKV